jgi:SAM-dependent methyltransferase
MHQSVYDYLDYHAPKEIFQANNILEIGAYNVNGSPRGRFLGSYYTGVDLRAGPGVDMVIDPNYHYPMWKDHFNLILCLETLEHDIRPWRTIRSIMLWLKPGGHAVITARGFNEKGASPYHDHPGDYWRFTPEGMAALLGDYLLEVVDCRPDPHDPGVHATARKPLNL